MTSIHMQQRNSPDKGAKIRKQPVIKEAMLTHGDQPLLLEITLRQQFYNSSSLSRIQKQSPNYRCGTVVPFHVQHCVRNNPTVMMLGMKIINRVKAKKLQQNCAEIFLILANSTSLFARIWTQGSVHIFMKKIVCKKKKKIFDHLH
jgi:hypothetical protein